MKLRSFLLALCAGVGLALSAAQAQVMVSVGNGMAHDCYLLSRSGHATRDAVALCDRALLAESLSVSDLAATHDNRGILELALDQADVALADFNMSIQLKADLGDAYVNRGSVLIKKRQYQDALGDINKGLDLGISFPEIGYYDRALAEELTGQLKASYLDYRHALDLEPHFVLAAQRLKDFIVTTRPAN